MAVDKETLDLNSSVQPIVEEDSLLNSRERKNKKLKEQLDIFEEWYFKVHRPNETRKLVSLQSLDNNSCLFLENTFNFL